MIKVKQIVKQSSKQTTISKKVNSNLASKIGGSGGSRTHDQRLMSPLLYLLSYATNSKNIP